MLLWISVLNVLQCKCRYTVPDTERRKTTNPLAAAVKLIAAPLISLWGFRDNKIHQIMFTTCNNHISKLFYLQQRRTLSVKMLVLCDLWAEVRYQDVKRLDFLPLSYYYEYAWGAKCQEIHKLKASFTVFQRLNIIYVRENNRPVFWPVSKMKRGEK